MFDLEKAIARWRRGLSQRRAFTGEDLDELEGHVRDHIEAQRAEGVSEKDAFAAAVRRIGDSTAVVSEYRKVAWVKARRRGGLVKALGDEATLIANYAKIGFRNLARHRAYALHQYARTRRWTRMLPLDHDVRALRAQLRSSQRQGGSHLPGFTGMAG